jgi:hypothetical protein
MQSCRHCSRSNPAEAIYCRECGRPLASVRTGDEDACTTPATAAADASAPTLPRVVAVRDRGGSPTRVAILVAGAVSLIGLAAGTGIKVATRRGRSVPPVNRALRASPPPTSSDDGQEASPSPDARVTPEPLKSEPVTPPPAGKAAVAQRMEAKRPERKAALKKPLGPPPADSEIRSCINRRRARMRGCADEAAQRMESVGGGTARATLNPSGTFSNIRVPGEGHFARCTTRAIRALRCRAYRGGPIEVSYPLR